MDFTDPIRYFIEGVKEDKLQEAVMGFNGFLKEDGVQSNPGFHAGNFVSRFHRTMVIVFETLEQTVQKLGEQHLENFKHIGQNYLAMRKWVTLELAGMIIDRKFLTDEKRMDFLHRLEEGNQELLLELQKIVRFTWEEGHLNEGIYDEK